MEKIRQPSKRPITREPSLPSLVSVITPCNHGIILQILHQRERNRNLKYINLLNECIYIKKVVSMEYLDYLGDTLYLLGATNRPNWIYIDIARKHQLRFITELLMALNTYVGEDEKCYNIILPYDKFATPVDVESEHKEFCKYRCLRI